MFYSDDIIAEVRSRNNIVDVVNSYVHLEKKGANYKGLCPFHNDHDPSMSVNANKQMFKCFVCGEGGNVISFVMKYENLTFPEAVKNLAARAGIALPEVEMSEADKAKANRKLQLLEVNKAAATYFYQMLRTPHGAVGLKYFEGRGLTAETMQRFGLGYAGINGREVVDYLRSKGFSDELIRDSGIASVSERNGLSSQFWNRVMYPIMDANHRVIGFGGRVMGDAKPKYLNSPETEIFDKRRNLYGFVFARNNKAGNFIICEGYMDVIAMHQAGFSQAVASLGTALTDEQCTLLARYTKKVYLAYDMDGPGVTAALRAIERLKNVGISARVISMQPCKDPDEFIKTYGTEAFQERIDKAENSFFFMIRTESTKFDQDDPEQRTEFCRSIAQKLCENFAEDVERENYLQAVCEHFRINLDNMRKLMLEYAAKGIGTTKVYERPKSTRHESVSNADKGRSAQAMLLTWLTDEPELYPKISKYVTLDDYTEELYRRVAERVYSDIENNRLDPAAVIDLFDEDDQKIVAGLFQAKLPNTETEEDRNRAFSDIIINVKQNSFECFSEAAKTDINAIGKQRALKQELEKLKKTGVTLN